MRHVLVQIDPSDDRESVIQFQSQEQPVLEDRPKLSSQSLSELAKAITPRQMGIHPK